MKKSIHAHEIPRSGNCRQKESSLEEILEEIGDYLPREGREMMEQIKNAKETFETYSQMMEMMNMMNEEDSQ